MHIHKGVGSVTYPPHAPTLANTLDIIKKAHGPAQSAWRDRLKVDATRFATWLLGSSRLLVTLTVPFTLALVSNAHAAYPEQPVTLVVPFTPGSGPDIIARIISPKLSQELGEAVVVLNRPGASGNIGADLVARSLPDGHTLLLAVNTITMTPSLYKDVPFDPAHDFRAVAKLAESNYALALHPSVDANDVRSLIELSKSRPGEMNYASPGTGTPHHLGMELLKFHTGADLTHVPYKGLAGATTDLIGGHVDSLFTAIHSSVPHALAGQMKVIAVTGERRSPIAPDIPTFAEQGFDFMDTSSWFGILVPRDTPDEIVDTLHARLMRVLDQPEVIKQLNDQGILVTPSTPDELDALIRSDLERWGTLIRETGISAD